MSSINGNALLIDRCPYCSVRLPNMFRATSFTTTISNGAKRSWQIFQCGTCGGAVLLETIPNTSEYTSMLPGQNEQLDESIPPRALEFLRQAIESKFSPSGSIMLCASSVDAMMKNIGYKEGNLYSRIEKAKDDHKITEEMSQWAHKVRLDSNEQRHDDEEIPLPVITDAENCIEFTLALGQFLFVLPARISKGLKTTSSEIK